MSQLLPPGAILSEAVLEALDYAGIGVAVTLNEESALRLIYASAGIGELLGRDLDELVGGDVLEIVTPSFQAEARELANRWRRMEPISQRLQLGLIHASGKEVMVDIGFAAVDLAGVRATIAFIIDATERLRSVEVLKRSEERFRLLVQTSPEPMAILRHGIIVFANKALARMPGFEVGSTWPSPSPALADALAAPAREPARTITELHESAGSRRRLEVGLFAAEFEEGPATIVLARDETERTLLQSQLLSADRLAAMGSLAAGIAHTINNPLTTVLLNLASVHRDLTRMASTSPEVGRALGKLREAQVAAERVRHSVRQVRGFSSWTDSPADLDVRSVLDAVLSLAAFTAPSTATLVNDYEPVPLVRAAEARLAQALLALIRNALQALPVDGEGEVLIRTFSAGDNRVVVEISDTGDGIPGEILGHIFEPFFTSADGRSGLGLTICRTIIEEIGGTIEVASSAHPTRFRITLPASRSDQQGQDTRPWLLLIEPDPEVAAGARLALRSSYRTRLVGSSRRGLEILLSGARFDLVVCDAGIRGPTPEELWFELGARRPGLETRMALATSGEALPSNLDLPRLQKPLSAAAVNEILAARAPA